MEVEGSRQKGWFASKSISGTKLPDKLENIASNDSSTTGAQSLSPDNSNRNNTPSRPLNRSVWEPNDG